jgi:hypothetical protein
MPVAPTTSATLRKCPSGAAACSSCGCGWAAPIARLHHQLIVVLVLRRARPAWKLNNFTNYTGQSYLRIDDGNSTHIL